MASYADTGTAAMISRKGTKGPPYNAIAVANYFLEKAKAKGTPINHMKLQSLIYFAHGWHLELYGEPLIDEEVQAWDFTYHR